ncbi:MAG: aspartate aminotransferase family protein, partial [Alphaproteobacteria bacterium]|nr:aspartate aminotransferase family protein [Alphaproteobacteria bacterium]
MDFAAECATAARALDDFAGRAALRQGPVIRQEPMADLARALDIDRLIAEGGLRGEAFERFLATYLGAATRLLDPRYMAHQVAVPHPMGAVAALIDGFTNNAMAIYEMGPSAATIEAAVVDWMLGKAGWNAGGGGVLTHGGSLANLTALMAARGRVAPEAWREGTPRDLVVIAPEACHYSLARAVDIMGLGQKALLAAPADDEGRIDPAGLERALKGRRVLAVVANACATAAGLYDPLRAVAEVCRKAGAWLHVDGAHGAAALLSSRHRGLLDGLELACSLTWDAHKMLRAPTLCAALLVRQAGDLDRAFHEEASYLFHDKDKPGFDFIHRTVECTKSALGLRLFMVLAAEGEAGLARFVDRQFDLAKAAARLLRARPGVEVAVEPEANIVCFRVDGDDARQLDIRRRLTARGEHYVSTAEFRG